MTTNDQLLELLQGVSKDVGEVRRSLRLRTVLVVGIVCVLIIGLGSIAIVAKQSHDSSLRSSRALAATKSQGAAARLASCLQQNASTEQNVAGDRAEVRELLRQANKNRPTLSPAEVKAEHDFLVAYDRTVISTHRERDCSPRGIAKFLQVPTSGTASTTTIPIGAP